MTELSQKFTITPFGIAGLLLASSQEDEATLASLYEEEFTEEDKAEKEPSSRAVLETKPSLTRDN